MNPTPQDAQPWKPGWWLGVAVFAASVVAALVLFRCCCYGKPESTAATCPASSLPPASACSPDGVVHNDMPNNDMPNNDMPNNDMPNNGLSVASLNANHDLLVALAGHALSQDLLDGAASPSWQSLLSGPYAPQLVHYIVSCALAPGETVDIPASFGELAAQYPCGFAGEVGLCSSPASPGSGSGGNPTSPAPSWRDQAASPPCLERVSACVLARVNALGASVPISIRGDRSQIFPKVRIEARYRENHGTLIQSFKRCDELCLWGDPVRRNCDWQTRYVGMCVRGPIPAGANPTAQSVTLALAGAPEARVRICKGIYGCDDPHATLGAGAATAPETTTDGVVTYPTYYGGQLLAEGGYSAGAPVEFECPDNGPVVKDARGQRWRTGYYGVMLAARRPGQPLPDTAELTLAVPAAPLQGPFDYGEAGTTLAERPDAYPATEEQVFTYREGAFYGSIFPTATGSVPTPATPPFMAGDQWACYSNIWSQGMAMFEARMCAGAASTCFANQPLACDDIDDPACQVAGAPIVYGSCHDQSAPGPSHTWKSPYTTYLNHPCDMFTSDEECWRVLKGSHSEVFVRRTAPPADAPFVFHPWP